MTLIEMLKDYLWKQKVAREAYDALKAAAIAECQFNLGDTIESKTGKPGRITGYRFHVNDQNVSVSVDPVATPLKKDGTLSARGSWTPYWDGPFKLIERAKESDAQTNPAEA